MTIEKIEAHYVWRFSFIELKTGLVETVKVLSKIGMKRATGVVIEKLMIFKTSACIFTTPISELIAIRQLEHFR